ncbi:MAG: hypothetical protein JNL57_02855 [Bacteroidetes bacterium]|nr:hypothetical protein [Bacteroidota bacterium]
MIRVQLTVLLGMCILGVYAQSPLLVPPPYTDSNIKNYTENHYVYSPVAPSRNRLMVFLPGTGTIPQFYQLFLKKAANMGYHVAGLMYSNAVTTNSICGTSSDTNCFTSARMEVLTGKDLNAGIDVNRTDCIENRLVKLLIYLKIQYPADNWAQFLENDSTVKWQNLVLTGHSQGAGHALFISKIYEVERVVSFAGMDYHTMKNKPASWVYQTGETPAERLYCFTHRGDEVLPFQNQIEFWQALKIRNLGGIKSADSMSPPYFSTHCLTTEREPADNGGTPYHNSTIVSAYVPKDLDNNPLYDAAWAYLLGNNTTGIHKMQAHSKRVWFDGTQFHSHLPATDAVILNGQGRLLQKFVLDNGVKPGLSSGVYFLIYNKEVMRFSILP